MGLEDAVAPARSIARIVGEAVATSADWDPRFRDPWLALLREAGVRATHRDPSLDGLSDRVGELSGVELPGRYWPVYGALLQSPSRRARTPRRVVRVRAGTAARAEPAAPRPRIPLPEAAMC